LITGSFRSDLDRELVPLLFRSLLLGLCGGDDDPVVDWDGERRSLLSRSRSRWSRVLVVVGDLRCGFGGDDDCALGGRTDNEPLLAGFGEGDDAPTESLRAGGDGEP
jgi:hypothetical protein